MAASGDVTVAENGGQGNVKLHPYLITLVRWCVSCLWSTATVLLHRLVTAQLPQIAASKPPPKSSKPRVAGKDHLHPEPKVECVVLHEPEETTLDVIFVHGLYGSLGNTWRQGDWKSKYKLDPNLVPLRDHGSTSCICPQNDSNNDNICKINEFTYRAEINESEVTFENINEKLRKILPNENLLITEKFYNNTLLDNEMENYETQAKFVRDMFQKENKETDETRHHGNKSECHEVNECVCSNAKKCEAGCGCVCDECYSTCWPKDWIKVDFPGARVISINYTSDPYLWRPLWIRGNKRLRLHERADQMMAQLLAMGVGKKPIIWVGHSKGGLFIKQIYCDAYEAHLKLNQNKPLDNNGNQDNNQMNDNNNVFKQIDIVDNNFNKVDCDTNSNSDEVVNNNVINGDNLEGLVKEVGDAESSNIEEETQIRANLWSNSAGFMFYSVPHRGSPLADIKTPITARSIELLEISKDCALVLSLQERWLVATRGSRPLVRSLVETGRTLMSVLWLRIVSVDSADAGIGSLSGVSVDHREICKPSSRNCLLYKELTDLIRAALNKCGCR
ncbi:hypothetical protein O3G_MSEX009428 [Manduca sexta]|uniref:Protein SERAC1 n=1 Tax=Manduca sexta TaxID=7130 RepID=A0A921ZEB3_MANSE|nr:hypothetical protein O3G_MSEX009428 [Manduca sexta]